MIDAPTLKALVSTVLSFAVVIGVGAFPSAIGPYAPVRSTVPVANPHKTVDVVLSVAAHSRPDRVPSTADAARHRL